MPAPLATSIIKLVPIGNPEDHLFEAIVVGGGTVVRTEIFESVSLDSNGQADVVLGVAPSSPDTVFVLVSTDARVAAQVVLGGIDGKTLTVQVRLLVYDRTKLDIHAGRIIESVVSVAGGSFDTGDTAPGASVGATSGSVGGATGDAIISIDSATVDAHHHSVDQLPDHGHQVEYDVATVLDVAAFDVVTLLVFYR